MNPRREEHLHLATGNHLLVGRGFAAIGEIVRGLGRMTARLQGARDGTLELAGVRLHRLGESPQELPELHVYTRAILAAHEMVDLAGEPHFRTQASPDDRVDVVVHFDEPGLPPIVGAMARSDLRGQRAFPVLHAPRPLDDRAPDEDPWFVELWRGVPWLALNRRHLTLLVPTPQGRSEE